MTYLLVSVFALCIMILLMPLLQRLALHIGAVDKPGARKVHTVPIPRIGGVLITFAILLSLVIFAPLALELRALMAGMMTVSALGLTDDLIGVRAVAKFGLQWGVALLFLAMVRPDPGLGLGLAAWAGFPIAAFFLVALVNAINLQDGLDGLAAGQVVISAVGMGIALLYAGQWILVLVLTATVSAVMGFLRVNTWPASIFMGDSGSYVLGFLLGAVFLLGLDAGVLPWWSAFCFFAIPIADTFQVIVGRLLGRRHIFHADRTHLHHRLLALGFEHQHVVRLEYILATIASMVPLTRISSGVSRWIAVSVVAGMGILFVWRQRSGSEVPTGSSVAPTWFRPALKWVLVLMSGIIYVYQLATFHASLRSSHESNPSVLKYAVLPTALAVFYTAWSGFRLRRDRNTKISTSLVLLSGTELFVYHQFRPAGGGAPAVYHVHLVLWLLLAAMAIGLVWLAGRDRESISTESPLDYLLVILAINLLFMPPDLKDLFQTDLVAFEMLAFFLTMRVAIRNFSLDKQRLVLPVASLLLVVLLVVGWL